MRIYLGGYLDFYHPQKGPWLEVPIDQPTPLLEVLTDQGIPVGEIQLVVVNGELADLQEAFVSDLDDVKIFSAVGGG